VTVNETLALVTAALSGAEDRPGQRRMSELVEAAIEHGRHVVVQAGTGTGKTLAYLVPAIESAIEREGTVVVATATKALQDQLAVKDLPFLDRAMTTPFSWAVLKGRSNYVCMQRVHEVTQRGDDGQGELELDDMAPKTQADIARILEWVGETGDGDVAGLDFAPSDAATRALTVGSDECPGADRCPRGDICFAEAAKARAAAADVVVVNTYLYGLDVAAEGAILPEHDVVIFDEAHGLEDIMSDTVGVQISPGRFITLGGTVRRILDEPEIVGSIMDITDALRVVLEPHVGKRLPLPYPAEIHDVLVDARNRLNRALTTLASIDTSIEDAKQKKLRAQTMTGRAIEHIDMALSTTETRSQYVDFVSGSPAYPHLEIAPLDVGPALLEGVWSKRTAILTSATIPASLTQRVGMPPGSVDDADVGSPFDYEHNALLYCALSMPDPRDPKYRDAVHDELDALITAAGGRTLALFTSWKAMDAAAEALKPRVKTPILTQRDLPKPALIKRFAEDESSTLLATAGFFQGVDVPGDTLIQVVIDRLPFPRPDDPLLSARRELLGPAAFSQIDLPRAAMMLAQAAGRLIRTSTDRGVVAVLDRRLGKANYRWEIVNALPPMRRTRHRADAVAFLTEIVGAAAE
jgi:ATP-dependent DNA helicase DinG